MLKKSITYVNFDGKEVTEDHYFNISKAELIEMQMGENDSYTPKDGGEPVTGYQAKLQRIIDAGDGAQIMAEFKNLILSSYGQRSEDGNRFIKNAELREEFASGEAYSTLFVELCTDAAAASEFVNGIIPQGLAQDVANIQDKPQTGKVLEAPRGVRGGAEEQNVFDEHESTPTDAPPPGTPRVLTRAEVTEMDSAELSHLLATGQAVIGPQD